MSILVYYQFPMWINLWDCNWKFIWYWRYYQATFLLQENSIQLKPNFFIEERSSERSYCIYRNQKDNFWKGNFHDKVDEEDDVLWIWWDQFRKIVYDSCFSLNNSMYILQWIYKNYRLKLKSLLSILFLFFLLFWLLI